MNWFKKFFTAASRAAPERAAIEVHGSPARPDLVPVSGLMSVAKNEAARLAARRGLAEAGYAELAASLQAEPNNGVDRNAIAIIVDSERIGYVPSWATAPLALHSGASRECVLQVFTEQVGGGIRIEAWAWLGVGRPRWQWSERKRPPMSTPDKRHAAQQSADDMVSDALRGGGERAADFRAGIVDGKHYLQLVEPIKQLKREERLDEALVLCYQAIEGAERSARRDGLTLPPFYTEQAAIVHRKLGQRDAEVAVLRRYLTARPTGTPGGRIQERLNKLLGP